MSLGAMQLIAVSFPAAEPVAQRVLALLRALDDVTTIRVLDVLFVRKDRATGDLIALETQGGELGAIVGALLGFEFDGVRRMRRAAADDGETFGLSREDVEGLGATLHRGVSAGFVLVEHRGVTHLDRELRAIGAAPFADGLLTQEAIADVADELHAAQRAADARARRVQSPG
jgi:hypothetical protein